MLIMPPLTTLAFYRPLHPSGTSPNLGEESECGLLAVSEFQVSADIPPLSRDTACRVCQCKGRHRGCFGHGVPCPYFIASPLSFHLSVFRLSSPPLCPPKLGGRAKRRGYVKRAVSG